MKNFLILITISLFGFAITVGGVYIDNKSNNGNTKIVTKLKLPFKHFIAGTGVIEPTSKNIIIGSEVSGVINKVYKKNNQTIKRGDLLFSLNDNVVENKLKYAQVQRAILFAKLQLAKHQYELIKEFKKLSPDMVTSKQFSLTKDKYQLALISLEALDEKLKVIKKQKSFYKIYSPINGRILNSTLTVGSYFNKNNPNKSLVIGSKKLNLQVSIDEYDIWRFKENTSAIAFVRGNQKIKIKLAYLYTIPYLVQKNIFSGKNTEKIDTKVLRIVYQLPDNISFPLYVGQQLDVFVQTDK